MLKTIYFTCLCRWLRWSSCKKLKDTTTEGTEADESPQNIYKKQWIDIKTMNW